MKLPFQVDFKRTKSRLLLVVLVYLVSYWVEALLLAGAKVAILDSSLRKERNRKLVNFHILGTVIGVEANVLNKASLEAAHEVVLSKTWPM